jgi:hypothetical protein
MMPPPMARNRPQKPDGVTHGRMQAIDDPTAAFPINKLSELVDQDDESSVPEHDPLPRPGRSVEAFEETTEEDDEAEPPSHVSPGTIQLGYVLLSLLGGGIAAAMFAALVVIVALLL